MQPIVPKGYKITEWPKALGKDQLAVREATATIAASQKSVDESDIIIQRLLMQYSPFFTAHFGLKPMAMIQETYFPLNHTVKQGGGAGNSLSIAQEIMAFQNPSAAENNMTIAPVIAILNAYLRAPAQKQTDAALQAVKMGFVEESVFRLNHRPTRDAMVAARNLPGNWKPNIAKYTNTSYFKPDKYGYIHPPNVGNTAPVWLERPHHAGFNIILKGVIDHYEELYQIHNTMATPREFWERNMKKRLSVEIDPRYGAGNYTVKVFSVDPVTGAPSGWSRAVARAPISKYPGNPGFLLAKVRQHLFPELYLISSGVTLESSDREKHYEDQLTNAKNMWAGIPDKSKTPIASVMSQSFTYPSIYNTGNAAPANPTPGTTVAINKLELWLQPTGIEDSMKRILDINHPAGNAIKKWFINDLMQTTTTYDPESHKYLYGVSLPVSSTSGNSWEKVVDRYKKTVGLVYALMDNPHVYAEGLSGATVLHTRNSPSRTVGRGNLFGPGHWVVPLPSPIYTQYLSDALKIFTYANWPMSAPQKMFSAPVDDVGDINTVLSMFNNYMNKEVDIAPGEMYVPESFNAILDHVVMAQVSDPNVQNSSQQGLPFINYGFTKPRYPQQQTYYFPSGMLVQASNTYTHKSKRFHRGAKTVVSKRAVSSTATIKMPVTIQYTNASSTASQPLSAIEQTTAIGAGVAGLVGLMTIYHVWQRR